MLQLLVEVKHLQYFVFVTFNLSKFFFLKEVGNVVLSLCLSSRANDLYVGLFDRISESSYSTR